MSTAPAEVTAPPTPTTPAADSPGAAEHLSRGSFRATSASLRVIFGLVVIWTIFQIANDRFLTAINLTNLLLQITAIGLISVGVVLVLLLGEIDLSIGAVSGLCAAIMAVLNVKHGWAPILGHRSSASSPARRSGSSRARCHTGFGIPSFVVTLAGLLAWQGALLLGARRHRHDQHHRPASITDLTSTFYSAAVGWIVAVLVIARLRWDEHLPLRRRRQRPGWSAGRAGHRADHRADRARVRRDHRGVAILNSDRGRAAGDHRPDRVRRRRSRS